MLIPRDATEDLILRRIQWPYIHAQEDLDAEEYDLWRESQDEAAERQKRQIRQAEAHQHGHGW